jgi:hypothetical protein
LFMRDSIAGKRWEPWGEEDKRWVTCWWTTGG